MSRTINSIKSDNNCAWCGAEKGVEAHSQACPKGERYKQVQDMGGIPWKDQVK